ncbi:Occludin domain containing protein [Trema orientale]|uniref:Occludin domain containing protein n=1 Tax=Trema orientale TaxID=63057 RepID=A0A2P5FE78_TREOI|nr:Occludin domain containing protein [Trema orientale]
MYGGSSKLGRGGSGAGRGAGPKRINHPFPMLPPHRPSAPASTGRLSLGGSASTPNPRRRAPGPKAPASASAAAGPAVEESFSLVAGNNPLAFAMIIKLAPDLVDEIRRVEDQGGTARIKFDAMANNPNGNVIDVGGKEFRFTWSRDFGDKCDIYEERQSGEDGNGLLVESGGAWRKVNVHRTLDESATNHVKMRSEEAERKHKSRKAIVLDHGNPSMKSQIKQLAAVETNPWKHFKQKKEPPSKKRKIEPPQVGGPPKSAYKSGMSSTTTVKGRHSSSPLPSPPEQSGQVASPFRTVNISKSQTTVDVIPNQVTGKDKAVANSDKDLPTRANSAVREIVGRKNNIGAKPMDLQSMLINLLTENPKGMSMKALEKAVGDSVPNSAKQIEAIMKKIATFQAPGKYLLKSGVESDSFKKRSSDSGSSPEENLHRTPAPEDNRNQTPASELDLKERVPPDEQAKLNSKLGEEPNALEKIDIQRHSPDLFGEKKLSDNSEGHAGSSSGSGSDSDSESDSSDTGSDSGSPSRSRSRSPLGSGSASSSDSDSDASSNSKEGSDEDVDIMTSDDDKEPKNKFHSEPAFSRSPISWRSPDGRPVQGDNDEKQNVHVLNAVEIEEIEIEKIVPDGKQETEIDVVGISGKDYEKPVEKTNAFSPDHDKLKEHQNLIGSLFDEGDDTVKDGSRYEQSDSSERTSKGKYKRGVEVKHSDDKSERGKRSKMENSCQPPVSGSRDVHYQESSHRLPSDKLIEDPNWGPIVQVTNGADRDGNGELTSQKGNNQTFSGKSSADFQQSSRRSFEQNVPVKAPDLTERPHNYAETLGRGRKYSEKSSHVHEDFPSQKSKFQKNPQYEDGYANEKKVSRNSKEGGVRGKQSVPFDSHYKKHGEGVGKFKDGGQISGSFLGTSPKDNGRTGAERSPAVHGRGSKLQREHSDLELGELREPLPEEASVKKQFERKSSFKQSENKPGTSDNWISDSKGKPAGKATLDLGKSSSPDLNAKVPSNLEGSNKKRNHEDRAEDSRRSQQRVVQSQPQYHSRADNVELPQSNKVAEMNGNSRQNEDGVRLGNALEGYGESNKKAPASQQHDRRRGLVSNSVKERKKGTSNTMAELTEGRTELLLAEGNNSERKRRDSSSDENSCSYSKYEKDEPDLKGPIKDFSQYKEYVQEYRDKYDSYCSLNKILESYRKEFDQLGKDLELAKGRDMEKYYNILEQLKESYRQCGTRHKRLKKIFVVLHEELKHLKQRIKDFALSYGKD